MNKRLAVILSGVLCALALAACSSSITMGPSGGKAEFSELDDTIECFCECNFTDIAMDVELESGSVDIEIVDVDVLSHEDDEYAELGPIFTTEGLVSGDSVTCSDNDGSFVIRITGHDATGTVTIAEG